MPPEPRTDALRETFLAFFEERGHTRVSSLSLVPGHSAAPLFTNAGMVQFLPIFLGEEPAPYPRATSSQKCLRVRGKHDDIDQIGRTTRHLTFFEMLGNFSFGDYFKAGAIEFAWEFLTGVLGLDGDRMWATVHHTDDEAARLWQEIVNMPAERIQRMGEDNFWEMGATGPCGPSSEIFYDMGPEHGEEGGPAHGGEERYVEIWNLVFMQYERQPDGSLEPLPKQNIDTGAGLERILPILQGTASVFETDVLRGLIATAEELSGKRYGDDEEQDVSLRIVADHARAVTFMIGDGVVPSNEERGYVLRRIIRRAVRHGRKLGAAEGFMPAMAAAVAERMRTGYPELGDKLDLIQAQLEREEHRFLQTLDLGMAMLEQALDDNPRQIDGETAFKLHDTYGFPVELTAEIAGERDVELDQAGFERAMERQREMARGAAKGGDQGDALATLRPELEELPATIFLGYENVEGEGTIVRVLPSAGGETVDLYTDRTPFYAESGGQIGDTGTIRSDSGQGRVLDTDRPVGNLIRHRVKIEDGELREGDLARLVVDRERRDAIRRAHTGTHLLHWALREVLGDQVHQQGSLVAPDYLRFDYNHHSPLTDEELARIESLVVGDVLTDEPVEVTETTLAEARAQGAMSFFGEKYGDVVRMVHAGEHSLELCGGTHVRALGQIGEFVVRSESSVGSNLRRIEAITGKAAHEDHRRVRDVLRSVADSLRVTPENVPEAVGRLQTSLSEQERERRQLVAQLDRHQAASLAENADDGVVVTRIDGRDGNGLREIADAVRRQPGVRAVGLVGSPDGEAVAVAVAFDDDSGDAPAAVRAAAKVVGGGGGGKDKKMAVGGGRDVTAIDAALDVLREALAGEPVSR